MARLNISDNFAWQKKLLDTIFAEHLKQADQSELIVYLNENNIDLNVCMQKAVIAQKHDKNRSILVKQSTNYTQLRNLVFKPIISNLKKEVQFLKSLNKNNSKYLGNWSIKVIGNNKISYPSNFDEVAKVAINFFDKHLSYTNNTSPLNEFILKNNIDVEADRNMIDIAINHHSNSVQENKNAENETEQRNLIWFPIMDIIRGIGNFLMKLYPDNPRALGAFGFIIDEANAKPKHVVTKIKLGSQITLKGVIIGGNIKNIGNTSVNLYKGKSKTNQSFTINTGEIFGIPKGFSIITIYNPNLLVEAKVSVLRVI